MHPSVSSLFLGRMGLTDFVAIELESKAQKKHETSLILYNKRFEISHVYNYLDVLLVLNLNLSHPMH